MNMEKHKILIVDDTPVNITVLSELLMDEFELSIAMSGHDALDIVNEGDMPDLILLDIMMPEMDGFEVCQRLKGDHKTSEIPIIFVTAKNEVDDEAKGFELGAVDFISKPISPPLVLARVRTQISLKASRDKLAEQNEQLIEANNLIEEVERIARHDLKNPLQTIISVPEILILSVELEDYQKDMLKRVEEAGYEMLHMINSSLDLFKMEQGTYKVQESDINLVKVLRKVIADQKSIWEIKNNEMILSLDGQALSQDDSMIICGEELLFYSMLSNLIRNALDASPDNEKITLSMNSERKSIQIHNMGAVPLDIRETFFDKYSTSGKPRGTGLGTYSARLISEAHGWQIEYVTSEEDGTAITITF
ncbi:hybrid sensor histidine kinase/response regulator, partial [Maridesulfovibrio frigidus]|uniref:hybrid sensor histidine kinase/response regulator n=1 Tax=Maridesulfovibrio frigidus TaxID=340956 RepID=UPI0004E1BA07